MLTHRSHEVRPDIIRYGQGHRVEPMEAHEPDDNVRSGDRDGCRVHVVIAVRLPDRPGALGAVASRIGAVGADITDVMVSARSGGFAEDVFHVDLPTLEGVDVVGLLLSEIAEVDGVCAPSVGHTVGVCCR